MGWFNRSVRVNNRSHRGGGEQFQWPDCLGLSLISCVTLCRLFKFSVLRFPHLWNEDNGEIYLLGMFGRLKNNMCNSLRMMFWNFVNRMILLVLSMLLFFFLLGNGTITWRMSQMAVWKIPNDWRRVEEQVTPSETGHLLTVTDTLWEGPFSRYSQVWPIRPHPSPRRNVLFLFTFCRGRSWGLKGVSVKKHCLPHQ